MVVIFFFCAFIGEKVVGLVSKDDDVIGTFAAIIGVLATIWWYFSKPERAEF